MTFINHKLKAPMCTVLMNNICANGEWQVYKSTVRAANLEFSNRSTGHFPKTLGLAIIIPVKKRKTSSESFWKILTRGLCTLNKRPAG